MDLQFWKDKKILLTGHTGFNGSWLSVWLKELGANVIGYSLPPPTNPSLFELANVAQGMCSITGDVRDLDHLKSVSQKYAPEILIHMAAQSLVVKSHKDPYGTYTTNVLGTLNVLETVRHSDSIKVVIIITSDKCYKNNEWVWGYREDDSLGGIDPYSNSKACAELITSAYRDSYFKKANTSFKDVAVATVRAGNVIGGGDWAENRLIPDVMQSLASNNRITIRNPNSIRPWQFVMEPLDGYLTLAERLWSHGAEYAEGWNFGPDESDAQTVSQIVEKLGQLWGTHVAWEELHQPYPQEANYLKLDCSKARKKLKWAPKLDLDTTLKWVVEWYKSYNNAEDVEKLTKSQVVGYQNSYKS
jgi:CDP-glucose 4,6-dehydratase